MSTVFEKLHLARQARGVSLEEISSATRIQTKVLKALEEGNISSIPDAYVRAFLKAYAREIGLDVTEILRDYAQQRSETHAPPAAPQQEASRPSHKPKSQRNGIRVSQTTILAVVAGIIVLSFVVSLSLSDGGNESGEVEEIPFYEVVKQQERRSPVSSADSGSLPPPRPLAEADRPTDRSLPQQHIPGDSLELRAMTFDSVWIRIGIDGKNFREYMVPPRWNGQWKARDRFVVSVNNATAVSFILNNAPIGLVGQPGEPVRNHVIRRRNASPGATRTEGQ